MIYEDTTAISEVKILHLSASDANNYLHRQSCLDKQNRCV